MPELDDSYLWLQVAVDRKDKIPPYLQIAAFIRHRIATAQLEPGTLLPSIRRMMRLAGVTTATVTRAYRVLQDEGLIEVHTGVGAIVLDVSGSTVQSEELPSELLMVFDQAVTDALRQGYSAEQIQRAVRRRLDRARSERIIAFSAVEQSVTERYASSLSRELQPLGITVVPLPLPKIRRASATTRALIGDAEHLVTVMSLQHEVRAAVKALRPELPVSLVLTHVALEASEKLSAIPKDKKIALVCQRRYRASTLGTLLNFHPQENIKVVRRISEASLRDELQGIDLIVHSLGTRDSLLKTIGRHRLLIEMEFALRTDSIQVLKRALSQ